MTIFEMLSTVRTNRGTEIVIWEDAITDLLISIFDISFNLVRLSKSKVYIKCFYTIII
jgi:hypothetical protein